MKRWFVVFRIYIVPHGQSIPDSTDQTETHACAKRIGLRGMEAWVLNRAQGHGTFPTQFIAVVLGSGECWAAQLHQNEDNRQPMAHEDNSSGRILMHHSFMDTILLLVPVAAGLASENLF